MSEGEPPNPFRAGTDQAAIWDACVLRDVRSFVAADWKICEEDFCTHGFVGWDAAHSTDPTRWRLRFPTLAAYRAAWEEDARAFLGRKWRRSLAADLFAALTLLRIDIDGDTALVHKRFSGELLPSEGPPERLGWQSLFHLSRDQGRWVQRGFVGYLPL